MKILKDLQDLCKKAIQELADKELLLASLKSEYEALGSKKAQLEADVRSGLEELKNVNVKVREERSRELQLIDDKNTDVGLLKAQTEAELQKSRAANTDLQNKLEAAEVQKAAADAFMAQLKEKEAIVEQRLAKLEALKSAI